MLSLKKHIAEHFAPTDWPGEMMGGLFVTLLVINYFDSHVTGSTGSTLVVVRAIVAVNLFWALIEGFLFIFTSLLYRGHRGSNTEGVTVSSIEQKLPAITFSRSDVFGALWVVVFSMLPSVVLALLVLLAPTVHGGAVLSNIVGTVLFFIFGYRLGAYTNRNKTVTGLIVAMAGSLLIAAGTLLGV